MNTAAAAKKAPAKKTTAKKAPAKKPAAKKTTAPQKEAPPAPQPEALVGGTKGIKIEVKAIPSAGYSKRKLMPEEYPFSMLEHSKRLPNGDLEGPSFFIPQSDQPQKHLARHRKQLKDEGYLFRTRKDTKVIDGETVGGLRVWRATKEEEAAGEQASA